MPRKRDDKPTIYLDSNILSVLTYRGIHMGAAFWHMTTKQWWDTEREGFRVYGSTFTERELSAGHYPGQSEAIKIVKRLPYLPYTASVRQCFHELIEQKIIPKSKPGDANQLAYATVHRIDYLLTWNYAHLANPQVQARLQALCKRRDWRAPLIVSPENIPRAVLGQAIERSDDA